jgi:hypothetical protein
VSTGVVTVRPPRGRVASARRATQRYLRATRLDPRWAWRPHRWVLLIGHQRSRSTLLAHILGSHPEIEGHSEQALAYTRRWHLRRLAAAVTCDAGHAVRAPFVLDKIVWRHQVGPTVLQDGRVRVVLLLRPPAPSLASHAAMTHQRRGLDLDHARQRALEAYCEQMRAVVEVCRVVPPRRRHLVESDTLVGDTEAVLAGLTRFLDLSSPLRRDYEVFPSTGVGGLGDPSPTIRAGTVIADGSASRAPIEPTPEAIERATAAWQHALTAARSSSA